MSLEESPGVGLSNATFLRQKFAHASLGRALQRVRGHLKSLGAPQCLVLNSMEVCALELREYTARPAGGRGAPGAVLMGTAHSHLESRLHTASSGGGRNWVGQEGQWGEGPRGIILAHLFSRLSLTSAFPPGNPAHSVPMESILTVASFSSLD